MARSGGHCRRSGGIAFLLCRHSAGPVGDDGRMPDATEDSGSFRTHAGYLRSLKVLAYGSGPVGQNTLKGLRRRAMNVYVPHLARRTDAFDKQEMLSRLHRAWATEALLGATIAMSDADMTRLGLAWNAVQTYYACSNAAQALVIAEGGVAPASHPATQRQFVDRWAFRRFALEPWSTAIHESGYRQACSFGLLNGPGRPIDSSVHSWSNATVDERWDIVAKSLRTTRENALSDRYKELRVRKQKSRERAWQGEENARLAAGRRARAKPTFPLPRLTTAEKAHARSGLRAYSMLDYLYRLRIKANYINDEMFMAGPDSDDEALEFALNLRAVAASTNLVHELRIGQTRGFGDLRRAMDKWLSSHRQSEAPDALHHRRALIDNL